jgi:hypothetical protein
VKVERADPTLVAVAVGDGEPAMLHPPGLHQVGGIGE